MYRSDASLLRSNFWKLFVVSLALHCRGFDAHPFTFFNHCSLLVGDLEEELILDVSLLIDLPIRYIPFAWMWQSVDLLSS